MTTTLTGHCLCGKTTATASGTLTSADACHCTMCRKQNAGGAFHAAQFSEGVTLSGEPLRWYAASEHGERAFCSACGSTLAWRLQSQPDGIGVSLGLFDTAPGKIDSRIFVEEAGAYADVPTDVPHKTGAEIIAEFMARQEQTS